MDWRSHHHPEEKKVQQAGALHALPSTAQVELLQRAAQLVVLCSGSSQTTEGSACRFGGGAITLSLTGSSAPFILFTLLLLLKMVAVAPIHLKCHAYHSNPFKNSQLQAHNPHVVG